MNLLLSLFQLISAVTVSAAVLAGSTMSFDGQFSINIPVGWEQYQFKGRPRPGTLFLLGPIRMSDNDPPRLGVSDISAETGSIKALASTNYARARAKAHQYHATVSTLRPIKLVPGQPVAYSFEIRFGSRASLDNDFVFLVVGNHKLLAEFPKLRQKVSLAILRTIHQVERNR